jgi:hypothetical protein
METRVTIEQGLNGHVKVTIDIGRESWSEVWKMTPDQARREAEEIIHQHSVRAA